jgi:hypothetical protein
VPGGDLGDKLPLGGDAPFEASQYLDQTICRRTRPARLYQAFPATEARRVLRRLEFHYVPKHAS